MKDRKEFRVLRAGVLMGAGAGLGLGCGAMMLADGVGLLHRLAGMQPTVVTLGIVPVLCFAGGVQLFRKAKAAD